LQGGCDACHPADTPRINIEEEIPAEIMETLVVRREDFHDALRNIEPSALREVFIEVPDVRWDDIGGLKLQSRNSSKLWNGRSNTLKLLKP